CAGSSKGLHGAPCLLSSPLISAYPHVRWFILKAFMERHAFPRIFFLDSDVILFANVTELATMLFSRVHLVVSQRWPRYERMCLPRCAGIQACGLPVCVWGNVAAWWATRGCIFFLDLDVILFANITELATMLFSRVRLVVSQRWRRYEWVRRHGCIGYGCVVWVRRYGCIGMVCRYGCVGVRGGGYGAGCIAIFLLDSDVILFANVTEVATRLFSRVHLVVSQRWPSMGVDVSVPRRQHHRSRHQALLESSSGGVAALAQVCGCLFANVTALATMLFSRMHLVGVPALPTFEAPQKSSPFSFPACIWWLSQRWPSPALSEPRAPASPNQYASTLVSGHVSLWTYDALSDCSLPFLPSFPHPFLNSLRAPGPSQYASTAVSGHVSLWTYDALSDFLDFFQLFVQCICDKESGVTPERSARIRGKFTPKFRVDSFATPRWCNATDWWDEGWCVFDNNFSIQTPTQFFKYRPQDGMKCPSSMHYTHFDDWAKEGEKQTSPVQFLGVHFQAHRKGYLTRGDDPAATWGSSPD
ncbi:unnamed protein product, partial [Closterium sp. NIES-65]